MESKLNIKFIYRNWGCSSAAKDLSDMARLSHLKGRLLHTIKCRKPIGHFLNRDPWGRAQTIVGGAILELVVLGSIKKQAEQVKGNQSVSSTLYGLCISSSLQVPALLELLLCLPSLMN